MRVFRALTPFRGVAASAVVLLVVGAGAAIGMATSPSGGHRTGAARTSTSAPLTTATSTPSTTAVVTTTTITTPSSSTVPVSDRARTSPGGQTANGASSSVSTPSGSTSGSSGSRPTTVAPAGPTGVAGAEALPPPGTYTYTTSGTSTVSFFGSSPYPSSTTIVVSRQGCGEASQWNSEPGSNTTVDECPASGGIHVVSESSTIQTHGYSQTMSFTCAANSFVPTSGTPGRTWQWACTSSSGETASQVVKLIGPESLTVGGKSVPTEHVTVDTTLSGPDQGTATTDYWLTSDALPVKEIGSINASQNGFNYSSNYKLYLDSLTPTS